MSQNEKNPNVTIKFDFEASEGPLNSLKSGCEVISKLDGECLREACNIFLEFLDGSIDLNKVLCININSAADDACDLITSLNLTNGAFNFLVALRAIESNGMFIKHG